MTYPCKARKYHEYKLVQTFKGGQTERCGFCGDKMMVRMTPEGRLVEPKKYKEAHIREFCQATGPTARVFAECYGLKPVLETSKMIEKQRKTESDRVARLEAGAAYLSNGNRTYFS